MTCSADRTWCMIIWYLATCDNGKWPSPLWPSNCSRKTKKTSLGEWKFYHDESWAKPLINFWRIYGRQNSRKLTQNLQDPKLICACEHKCTTVSMFNAWMMRLGASKGCPWIILNIRFLGELAAWSLKRRQRKRNERWTNRAR